MKNKKAFYKKIGSRLKAERNTRLFSQAEIAKSIDLDQPTISRIEAGTRPLYVHELVSMLDLYSIDISSVVYEPQ